MTQIDSDSYFLDLFQETVTERVIDSVEYLYDFLGQLFVFVILIFCVHQRPIALSLQLRVEPVRQPYKDCIGIPVDLIKPCVHNPTICEVQAIRARVGGPILVIGGQGH